MIDFFTTFLFQQRVKPESQSPVLPAVALSSVALRRHSPNEMDEGIVGERREAGSRKDISGKGKTVSNSEE